MGAILALATPGFDLAYLAWFGLIPLLILTRACNNPPGNQSIHWLHFWRWLLRHSTQFS
jgi:apolipoprotein N-acyltransferase